jgi:ATP-binding cassette, subfamily C (CFTR/MRP), member 1
MILIAISSRYLGATIPFVLLVCIITQRLYIRTSRQLRFLDLEAKGPLYTQFIETLNGLHTLRAFNLQSTLSTELSLLLDASQKPFYLLLCAQRWLGLVLNLTNMGLALMLIGVAIATRARFHASGFLGVALINIMTFGNSLASFINVWATLETSLAAVERVKHFSEETPLEVTEEPIQVPDSWPEKGGIEIQDLCIGYTNQ